MVGSEKELPAWRSLTMGRHGAVVTHHPLATQAGLDVLHSGGNAFDAAIAAATTLTVVEPYGSGIGGDGLFLLWRAEEQRAVVVQALSRAPNGVTSNDYADGIDAHSARATAVPALAAGWAHIARRYGTQPTAALFEAAIHYARGGFPASRTLCRQINARKDVLTRDRGCAAAFLLHGDAPHPGSTLRNAALGRTLEVLGAVGGWDPAAEPMARFARFCQEQGGYVTDRDLAETDAVEREAIESTYDGKRVLSAAPPSMGFTFLLELNVLDYFGMQRLGHLSADAIHLMVEAKKLAFEQREAYAGDPARTHIPIARLVSRQLANGLAARLDPRRRTPAAGTQSIPGDTSYFCVIDEAGNAVSGIQSLAESFGACVMDPGTGVLLNNRMLWFHLDPDHPNFLEPGRYMRQTMNTPMVLHDGTVRAVLGTPGGDGQYQAALQVLTGILSYGLDPQQAVSAPRWAHFQPRTSSAYPHLSPDVLLLESRIEQHVVDELKRRGHRVATVGPYEDACTASLILRDPTGVLLAGADPRRDGWAGAF